MSSTTEHDVNDAEPVRRGVVPIEFHLRDDAGDPVLSARTDGGQKLTLTVINATPGDILFPAIEPHSTGAARHHLVLRFRKGILRDVDRIESSADNREAGWELDPHGRGRDPRFDELAFHSTLDTGIHDGKENTLTLEHVCADPERGARSSRVEMLYRNLVYKDAPLSGAAQRTFSVVNKPPPEASDAEKAQRDQDLTKILQSIEDAAATVPPEVRSKLHALGAQVTDLRTQAASVKTDHDYLSHIKSSVDDLIGDNPDQTAALTKLRGASERIARLEEREARPRGAAPLRIGFGGSNTILNDHDPQSSSKGTSSHLILELSAHASHDGVRCKRGTSKLVVGIDVSVDASKPHALCTAVEATSITVSADGWVPRSATLSQADTDGRMEVSLEPESDFPLSPGEPDHTIRIDDVRSSLPSGPAKLYVRVENISTDRGDGDDADGFYPGDEFILPVVKTPLYFNNRDVCIGTTNPGAYRFAVVGTLGVTGGIGIARRSKLEFGAETPDKEKDAGTISYEGLSDNALDIVGAGTDTTNRRITLHAEGCTKLTGPLVVAGQAWVQSDLAVTGTSHLNGAASVKKNLTVSGKIGVGIDPPEDLLHVKSAHDAGLIIEAGQEPYIEFRRRGGTAAKKSEWMLGIDDNDEAFRIARATGELHGPTGNPAATTSFVDIRAPVRNTNVRMSEDLPAFKTTSTTPAEIHAFEFTTYCESDVLILADFQDVNAEQAGCGLSFGIDHIKSLKLLAHRCCVNTGSLYVRGAASNAGHILFTALAAGTHRVVAQMSTGTDDDPGSGTAWISGGTLTVIQL